MLLLSNDTQLRSLTNVSDLVFIPSEVVPESVERVANLRGVSFQCTSEECKDQHVTLAATLANQGTPVWAELLCKQCQTKYIWKLGEDTSTVQKVG